MSKFWLYKNLAVKWDRPPGVLKKDFQAAVMEALDEYVEVWKKDALPKHFTVEGGREYGYQRRSRKYTLRKSRDKRSAAYGRPEAVRPLVFTGALEKLAEQNAGGKTSRRRLVIEMPNMPRYLFQYKPGAPNKLRELTSFSAKDGRAMRAFVAEKIATKYSNHKHPPQTVKG